MFYAFLDHTIRSPDEILRKRARPSKSWASLTDIPQTPALTLLVRVNLEQHLFNPLGHLRNICATRANSPKHNLRTEYHNMIFVNVVNTISCKLRFCVISDLYDMDTTYRQRGRSRAENIQTNENMRANENMRMNNNLTCAGASISAGISVHASLLGSLVLLLPSLLWRTRGINYSM